MQTFHSYFSCLAVCKFRLRLYYDNTGASLSLEEKTSQMERKMRRKLSICFFLCRGPRRRLGKYLRRGAYQIRDLFTVVVNPLCLECLRNSTRVSIL